MPSGVHINDTERNLILVGVQKESSVDKIFEDVFDSDANRCSKAYLSRVCTYLQSASTDEIVAWLAGKVRTGNKSGHYLDDDEISHVVEELSTSRPKRPHSMIADDVTEIVGDGVRITRQEISRFLKRHKISSHKISFVSALIDEDERAETLELARPYETSCLHNFDETSTAYTKFIMKETRCHKGETPSQPEWNLIGPDGRVYSVIADYTPNGWSCWRTFLRNIDHECVELFLQEDLSCVLSDGDVVLHDGASIHKVQSTIDLLAEITDNRYIKVAKYSHDLSPVERGFANVWNYIHTHYDPSTQSPVEIINEAFAMYSVTGPLGYKGNTVITLRLTVDV
jgi:hypothetical protein